MGKQVQRATLESLLKKTPRTVTVEVSLGADAKASMLFKALGSKAYDELIAEHPPTSADKKDGGVWNSETFPPALIAECSLEPRMSVEDAASLWKSEDWSRGELFDIFTRLVRLNQEGLDVPFK